VTAETGAGGSARTGARSGVRWVAAGLVDQAVIASTNAGTVLLAAGLLDRDRAGAMLISLSVAYVVMGLNRAFVGDVLVALASRYEGEQRDRLVRNGLAAAFCVGLLASVVLVGVWASAPRSGLLRDLIWVAPFLPMILLHDTARCSYLADRTPGRALVIDLVWAGAQALGVLALVTAHAVTAEGLLVAWGLGATAGATIFLLRSRERPWRGDPRRWATETRSLSGWFTTTAVVGQFQVLAVNFLVAWRLGSGNVTGLRTAQVALLQPVQNFNLAMMGLLVPRASRLARDAAGPDGSRAGAAAAGLRRQTRVLAALFGAAALLMVAVLWPLASTVLGHIEKFADVAPLALPISLQAGMYLVQTPFQAALRGMHRARMLFVQYVIFTTTSLAGLMVGAAHKRLVEATWGLTVGAVVGLVVMIGLYGYALRELAAQGGTGTPQGAAEQAGPPTPIAVSESG